MGCPDSLFNRDGGFVFLEILKLCRGWQRHSLGTSSEGVWRSHPFGTSDHRDKKHAEQLPIILTITKGTRMKNATIINHPLVQRDVSILRDKNTPNHLFRSVLSRVAGMMAFEVTKNFELEKFSLHTPLEKTNGFKLRDQIVIVPVLRAGLGMVEGFMNVLPEARVGHVGLYRDEETLEPVDYYSKFPKNLSDSLVLLIDPMLATGGSAKTALTFLKNKGARNIRMVCLVASPAGIKIVAKKHPDVHIYCAVVDRALNAKGYILPGLGDAGDRVFGTE